VKLLSFETSSVDGRAQHLGALVDGDADDGAVIDLTAAARSLLVHDGTEPSAARRIADALVPPSLLGLVEAGSRGRELADEALEHVARGGETADPFGAQLRFSTADVRIRPAISSPPLLRDFMAFEKHLVNVFPKLGREIPPEWYNRPVYYKGNPSAIGAHGEDVAIPAYADQLDLEFEFAAIIGRGGVDIDEGSALGHIFGYTIYDDFSAREIQAAEMTVGLGPAKGKDFLRGHVLGPVVVTSDEIPDPYGLTMHGEVNGETWTEGDSADMHWRFEQMIAYASRDELVRPGEVFGSGTVGDGSGAERGRHLVAGDLVELTMGGIGTLRNRVTATNEGVPSSSDA
jgi:2-keto-4-pentenoate hydratase/2-oxohepta-3-ene-1,7-dioic acid hydratase in catechol pathway